MVSRGEERAFLVLRQYSTTPSSSSTQATHAAFSFIPVFALLRSTAAAPAPLLLAYSSSNIYGPYLDRQKRFFNTDNARGVFLLPCVRSLENHRCCFCFCSAASASSSSNLYGPHHDRQNITDAPHDAAHDSRCRRAHGAPPHEPPRRSPHLPMHPAGVPNRRSLPSLPVGASTDVRHALPTHSATDVPRPL